MQYFRAFGGILGIIGVGMGAIGSHALRPRFQPGDAEIFGIAVVFLLVHAVTLLALSVTPESKPAKFAGWLWLVGAVLFSGAILTRIATGVSLGWVAPAGGLALMAGWLLAAGSAIKR